MSLSPAFLDELRARTSLSALIGRKMKLTKAGREMKGCCPFHGEKTPSFYVNDDKAFYHCFGCSAHGDAIRWMTDHEGLGFMDAVKELAAAAGMQMPAQDPRHAEKDAESQVLYEIMQRAADWFAFNLGDAVAAGPAPANYLVSRGINPATAHTFGIGWAPGGSNAEPLHRHLKDVSHARLVALGLCKIHEEGERKGEIYDFFRSRVMFPIHDTRGRVIGFGGRVMGDRQPKYLNSPDTPIFDKGATVYNVHRAAPAARAAGRVIVVEGYMDVIGLRGAGVEEAVAPNGTALTEGQISRLWRLAPTPILCFDGDKAGKAAAARAAIRALPLLEPDRSLSFVTPPAGKDPDDVARAGGKDAIEAMLARPRALVDVIWEHEVAAGPVVTPEQKAGLAKRLRDHVGVIRNRGVAEAYFAEFKQRYDALTATPARGPRPNPTPTTSRFTPRKPLQTDASKRVARGSMRISIEQAVVLGLISYPDVALRESEALGGVKFQAIGTKTIADALLEWGFARNRPEKPDLAALEEQIAWARAGALKYSFTRPDSDPERAREDLAEAIWRLR